MSKFSNGHGNVSEMKDLLFSNLFLKFLIYQVGNSRNKYPNAEFGA
jgi:hypothetical protein